MGPPQRDVENVAFEHRQKILREEERLRNWRAEVTQAADAKEVGGCWCDAGVVTATNEH